MQPSELLIHFMDSVHNGYMASIDDLDDEQLHWQYSEGTVAPGFHAWHYFRTKDNIINFVCQDRRPPVWLRQGLDTAWGFPRVAQGTDMDRGEAQALRFPSCQALVQYGLDVHEDVMEWLRAVSDDELAATVRVVQFGHQAKSQQILQTCIAHGNGHLGQILALRSVMGFPARIDM